MGPIAHHVFSLPSVAVRSQISEMYVSGVLLQSTTASRGRRTTHCIGPESLYYSTVVAFLRCVLCSTQRALGLLLQQRIYDEVMR